MTMVLWKSDGDYYLLSYEHFNLAFFPSKMGLKKCFSPQHLDCRCGPTATVTSLKDTGMKVLIKHFKERGLAPETMLRTQRSRPFPKPEKWLIFGILAKGGPHENFYDAFTNNL